MEEIKVYDKDDQQITLLVQWDLDVYIYIKEDGITSAQNVHFFNSESDVAYVTESTYSDGVLCTKIPNRLLFVALPITGYIYATDDNYSYRNEYVFNIPVRARTIPSDFAYINDDSDDYINTEKVLAECRGYAESAQASAEEAENWTNLSKSWAVGDTGVRSGEDTDNSKYYAKQAATSESNAATSEKNAKTSETNAKSSEEIAVEYGNLSKSYAVGGTGTREGEDEDNAYFYYLQCGRYAASFEGVLRPMGSVYFADLPSVDKSEAGDLYNIVDTFITTSDFLEGEGIVVPYGSDVYLTSDGQWDVLGGTGGYDAVDMLMTGVATGWLMDENGQIILSEDGTGISLSWDICQYDETEKARVDALESEMNMVKEVADDLEARVYELEIKTIDDVEEADIDKIFISTTRIVTSEDETLIESETVILPLADTNDASGISDTDEVIIEVADLETRVTILEVKLADDVSESDVEYIFELFGAISMSTDDSTSDSTINPSSTDDSEDTDDSDDDMFNDGDKTDSDDEETTDDEKSDNEEIDNEETIDDETSDDETDDEETDDDETDDDETDDEETDDDMKVAPGIEETVDGEDDDIEDENDPNDESLDDSTDVSDID